MYNFIKGVVLIALIIFLGMKIHGQYSPQTPSTANAVVDSHEGAIANQAAHAEGTDKPVETQEQKTEVSPEVITNDQQKSTESSTEASNKEYGAKQSKKDWKSKQFLSEEDKRLTMLAKNESNVKNSLGDLPVESSGEPYNPERIKNIGEIYEKTVSILDAME